LRSNALLLLTFLVPAGVRGDLRLPAPGRVIDLGREPGAALPQGDPSVPKHFLVKLAAPLDRAEIEELRRAGISVSTVLARDAAVVYGAPVALANAPAAAWFSALVPEDKAPAALLAGSGPLPRVSVLGHPGTTASALADAALEEGLRTSGGGESRFGARIEIEAGADRSALGRLLARDPVFAAFPALRPRLANDRSVGTIQSGTALGPTPIFDHGLFGQGQTIGILDTGLDVDSCYFADPEATFPVNSLGARALYGVQTSASHRKIAAYDFLHPCGPFPPPCDRPEDPGAWDDQGHGTHVAGNAAGDDLAHPLLHDPGDGMAPGARLVVQDAGYAGPNDPCGELPGVGCAPSGLEAIFDQAYAQGVRIHSDSWSDDSLGPPPANSGYSLSARDVDDFVFRHPDFLPFFVAGNAGASGPRSVPSPGNGKNVVCVGSTRNSPTASDDDLSDFSGVGPAADGRTKPDLVAPGYNVSAASDFSISTDNCSTGVGAGTSFAAPTAAGAAALVREYFVRGSYPSGSPDPASVFSPSAALVKAALIASAVSLPGSRLGVPVAAAPSFQQGFGRIDLSRVLAFPDSPFRIFVADRISAFSLGSGPISFSVTVRSAGTPLRATLAWTDPPGVPRSADDSTSELVDDLDLSIEGPGGAAPGNGGPGFDRINNVEQATIDAPAPGEYSIRVDPHFVAPGPPVGFALVVTGDIDFDPEARLSVDSGSATLADGMASFVSDCETRVAGFRIVNDGTSPSEAGSAVAIESLDSAAEVVTASPVVLPALPPGGSIEVDFQFRTAFDGIPVSCAGSLPFRVSLASGPGIAAVDIEFPTAPGPDGCGSVGALTCAPSQIRPVRPRR
jgi:hypothetical protein